MFAITGIQHIDPSPLPGGPNAPCHTQTLLFPTPPAVSLSLPARSIAWSKPSKPHVCTRMPLAQHTANPNTQQATQTEPGKQPSQVRGRAPSRLRTALKHWPQNHQCRQASHKPYLPLKTAKLAMPSPWHAARAYERDGPERYPNQDKLSQATQGNTPFLSCTAGKKTGQQHRNYLYPTRQQLPVR